jgi:NAD(P)-dependent dehydrogenase (short-subunit alcohol dehydrogenase family)
MSEPCAILTGVPGALGSAVARHLASRGYKIALLAHPREIDATKALAEELGSARARAYAADASTAEGWSAALPAIERDLAPPTAAVLAAGGWRGGAPFHAGVDDATWNAMMTGNLETVRRAFSALLPGMVARRAGSIVVIGSRVAEQPWTGAGAAAYTASKAAVVALAQAVAAEVFPHGVRINAVLPSTLDTPANRRAMPSADPTRWVSLDSAADAIAFLLSDAARDVSGAALPLYGQA